MKNNTLIQLYRVVFFGLLIGFIATSCVPMKKLRYVSTPKGIDSSEVYKVIRTPKTIQPFDYLNINVYSTDERVLGIFRDRQGMANRDNINLVSYQVNEKGYINFPFVGHILVKDMDLSQAQLTIEKTLRQYLANTSVVVRFVGNKLTVLGAVNRPGEYTFYDEKVNIFQAVGYAGGMSNFANLKQVTVVREVANDARYYHLDLTSKDVVESGIYYLQPNDVIIIESMKARYRAAYTDYTLVALLLTGVTTLISVLTFQSISKGL